MKIRKKLEQKELEKSFNTTRKAGTTIGKWENEYFTEKINVKDEDMNDYNQ